MRKTGTAREGLQSKGVTNSCLPIPRLRITYSLTLSTHQMTLIDSSATSPIKQQYSVQASLQSVFSARKEISVRIEMTATTLPRLLLLVIAVSAAATVSQAVQTAADPFPNTVSVQMSAFLDFLSVSKTYCHNIP